MSSTVRAAFPACVLLASFSTVGAVIEEPISLSTPERNELHGTLVLPAELGPHTVALIIAGSGPTDRNGNNPTFQNDGLKMLAHALASGGIASLRYDKRGVGASAASLTDESELVFHDLVDDARAWLKLLAADQRFSSVVVIGHSEGATIGLLAAQHSAARAYVSIAGPGKRASQGLRSQLEGKLPTTLADRNEQILTALEAGTIVQDVPPALMALYRPSLQPYLVDWFKVVPTDEIKKLPLPCLIVQGTTDLQVTVPSAHALHDANPKAELVIVEGMNHVLKLVPLDPAKQLVSYRDASLPIAAMLSDSIIRFIRFHVPDASEL